MTRDTRIALFLMGELVAALRANDSDAFRGLLSEGMQELGVKEVEELGDKVPAEAKAKVELTLDELKEVLETEDTTQLQERLSGLQTALMEMGAAAYASQEEPSTTTPSEDDIIDAEVVESPK